MKKTLLITLILVVLLVILTSCQVSNTEDGSGTDTNETPMHTVTFALNDGGDGDFTASIERGTGIPKPQDPVRNGYTFEGWYVDDEKWSFITHTVNNDITLYAKWEPVTYQIEYIGAQGEKTTYTTIEEFELPLGEGGNGSYIILGWYFDQAFKNQVTKIEKGTTGNLKLYAKIEIQTPEPEVEPQFTFARNSNSWNYTLVKCNESDITSITIPSTYKGGRVTEIAPYAFYGCTSLKSIELPNTITAIGDYAFSGCERLQSIEIENVSLIGEYAFEKCYSLTSVKLGTSLTSIGKGAFEFCSALECLEILKNVEYVGAGAFPSTNITFKVFTEHEQKPENWESTGVVMIWGYTGQRGITESGYEWASTTKGIVITGYDGEGTVLKIPSNIEGSNVVGICSRAFKNRTTLKSILIPSTIESIGKEAFTGSTSLTIYIEQEQEPQGYEENWHPKSGAIVWGYLGTNGVTDGGYEWARTTKGIFITGYNGNATDLELPSKVANKEIVGICDFAFNYRTSIISVVIPDSITIVGERAFANCSSLETVIMGNNIKTIGDYAFYYCTRLKEIELVESITYIGQYAFAYCVRLESIRFPSQITEISDYVLQNCTSLTSIELPNGIKSIGNSAFLSCTSLANIEIPSEVEQISAGAFQLCKALEEIEIPSGVTKIENDTFYGCHALKKVILPSGITSIGENAFRSCILLEGIDIPQNLTSIGAFAFYSCESLNTITIPNGVEVIELYTFAYCESLESIEIPRSVTSISMEAFSNCRALKRIDISSEVAEIGARAFFNCRSLTIYCEQESKPENWHNNWNPSNRPVYWNGELDTQEPILDIKDDLPGVPGLNLE